MPRTDALDLVLELVVLLGEDMAQSLAGDGLTVSRARLVWLLHHTGPSTQRALADALKVTPRNVTGLVDGLAQAGYVVRRPHPSDRRATLVTLTEHGAQKLTAMDAAHRELAELLFAGMPDAQYAAFVGGVEHVVARLREALR